MTKIEFEFITFGEFLVKLRWPLLIGLPYAFSVMMQYASPNWFTIPTMGLMIVLWIAAIIMLID